MRLWTLVLTTLSLALSSFGQSAPLRVMASNGMKAVIDELRPRLERELGRTLVIDFNTSTAVRQRIESNEAFDVAVLTKEVVDDLAKAGKITSASVVDLGRSGI